MWNGLPQKGDSMPKCTQGPGAAGWFGGAEQCTEGVLALREARREVRQGARPSSGLLLQQHTDFGVIHRCHWILQVRLQAISSRQVGRVQGGRCHRGSLMRAAGHPVQRRTNGAENCIFLAGCLYTPGCQRSGAGRGQLPWLRNQGCESACPRAVALPAGLASARPLLPPLWPSAAEAQISRPLCLRGAHMTVS